LIVQSPYLTADKRIVGLSPNHWAIEQDEHGFFFRERTEGEWLDIIDPRRRTAVHQARVEHWLSEFSGEPPHTIRTGRKVPKVSGRNVVPSGRTRAWYDEIRERTDIVELAQELTDMRHVGKTWKGICPFHAERTPSFVVWPESQNWRCFGACAEGGDVISLAEKAQKAGLM